MGIKHLWEYYKSNVGYGTICVDELKGKFVAEDIYGTMYATRCVAKDIYLRKINPLYEKIDDDEIDRIWLDLCIEHLLKHLKYGFIPVYVYDGKHSPLKTNTLKKRSDGGDKAREEIATLIKKNKKLDIMSMSTQDADRVRSLLNRVDHVPTASKNKFIDLHKRLGVPWVESNGEGERTCSLMNHWGVVEALISEDSDCLPCGGKLILRDYVSIYDKNGNGSHGFVTAGVDNILDNLDMDILLFQDLCIMLGTDFNPNIRNIGLVKCLALINKHRSISKIGKREGLDVSCLNHVEVRKMFDIIPWEDTVSDMSLKVTFNKKVAKAALAEYGLSNKLSSLAEYLAKYVE